MCNNVYQYAPVGYCGCNYLDDEVLYQGSTPFCKPRDECERGEDTCDRASQNCVDTEDGYDCVCKFEGAVFDEDLKTVREAQHITPDNPSPQCSILFPYSFKVYSTRLYMTNKFDIQVSVEKMNAERTTFLPVRSLYFDTVANETYERNALEPGTNYRLDMNFTDELGENQNLFATLKTHCGCRYITLDSAEDLQDGKPLPLRVYQERGNILFQWIDDSLCTQSFTFTRYRGKIVGNGTVEIDHAYKGETMAASYFATSTSCGRLHKPGVTMVDDISRNRLELGATYVYCITSENSFLQYRSEESCFNEFGELNAVTIQFEAAIKVDVATATGVPVQGVSFFYTINQTGLDLRHLGSSNLTASGLTQFGLTSTLEDGVGEVYIINPYITSSIVKIHLYFFKESNGLSHNITCDDCALYADLPVVDQQQQLVNDFHEGTVALNDTDDSSDREYEEYSTTVLDRRRRRMSVADQQSQQMLWDAQVPQRRRLEDVVVANSRPMVVRFLNFDTSTSYVDKTSIPLVGVVTIANTLDCPIKGIRVCVDGQGVDARCTETNGFGEYRLAIAANTETVVVYVNLPADKKGVYENHVFRRKFASEFEADDSRYVLGNVGVDKEYFNLDFEDVSTVTKTISLAGGLCGFQFYSKFDFEYSIPHCAQWVGVSETFVPLNNDDHTIVHEITVPAHELEFRIVKVYAKDGGVHLNAGGYDSPQPSYFKNRGGRITIDFRGDVLRNVRVRHQNISYVLHGKTKE